MLILMLMTWYAGYAEGLLINDARIDVKISIAYLFNTRMMRYKM